MEINVGDIVREAGAPAALLIVWVWRVEPAMNKLTNTINDLQRVLLCMNGTKGQIGEAFREHELQKQKAVLQQT